MMFERCGEVASCLGWHLVAVRWLDDGGAGGRSSKIVGKAAGHGHWRRSRENRLDIL